MAIVHPAMSRHRLLERIRRADAALLSIVAPAGFGKSTVAREWLVSHPPSTLVDCYAVGSERDLAARVLRALADEQKLTSQGRATGGLVDRPFAGSGPPEDVTATALEAFRFQAPTCTMLFENVEQIVDVPGAVEFVGSLLDRPHISRRLILCSRTPLPFRTTGFAPPHATLSLRADDLRFDTEEIRRVLAEVKLESSLIETIERVTRGWPIAVLLMKRFAGEGKLGDVISNLARVEYDDLFNYLITEVLSKLAPPEFDELFFISAIPDLSAEEWTFLRDDESARRAVLELPFVAMTMHGIDVHPLVRATLLARYPSAARDIVRAAASRLSDRTRGTRSAALFLSIGDVDEAATAITRGGSIVVLDDIPQDVAEVIAALPPRTLEAHPDLWAISLWTKTYTISMPILLSECRRLWNRYSDATNPAIFLGVFNNFANALVQSGRLDEAETLIAHTRASMHGSNPIVANLLPLFLELVCAYRGRPIDDQPIEREYDVRGRSFLFASDTLYAIRLFQVEARRFRLFGLREREALTMADAVQAALRTGDALVIAGCLAEATFSSWFWGDDAEVERSIALLESSLTWRGDGLGGFLLDCVRGRARLSRPRFEDYKVRSYAYLFAASIESGSQEATLYAAEAVVAADQSNQLLPRVLSRVAIAVVESSSRERRLHEALDLAQTSESVRLVRAVESLLGACDDHDMLEPFLRRFARRKPTSHGGFHVSLLGGSVEAGGTSTRLTALEYTIVATLVDAGRPLDGTQLAERIWPDDPSGVNRLHVAIRRLRDKLGDEFVLRDETGYRLPENASIDITEIEHVLRRRTRPLSDAAAAELKRWDAVMTREMINGKLHDVNRAVFERLRRQTKTVLAHHAAERGEFDEVLARTRELRDLDPCDEVACELSMRANLAKSDRPAAIATYRAYKTALKSELDAEPSGHLAALLEERASSAVAR